MNEMIKMYRNASYVIAGGVCFIWVLTLFHNNLSAWTEPLIPGFSSIRGLCIPTLCLWVGILIRYDLHQEHSPRWWLKGIALAATLGFMCAFILFMDEWDRHEYAYLDGAAIGFGYLISPSWLLELSKKTALNVLIPSLLSVFCYIAISVAKYRLLWGQLIPEHRDMEALLEDLMVCLEAGMVILCLYFIMQIAFSKESMNLGDKNWFRGVVAGGSVYIFLTSLVGFNPYYWPAYRCIGILTQPLPVYIFIKIYLQIKNHFKKDPDGKDKSEDKAMKYLENMNSKNRVTSDNIVALNDKEIFVFGSNRAGMHGGGAAATAHMFFGAIWGQGVGLQGQSYAIPTMEGGIDTVAWYVEEFIVFAKEHPELKFLVTQIGCGIAGFTPAEIAPLFHDAMGLENVSLPKSFWEVLDKNIEQQ